MHAHTSSREAVTVACLKDFRAFQGKIQFYNVICLFELPSGVFCKYVALITNEVIPKKYIQKLQSSQWERM